MKLIDGRLDYAGGWEYPDVYVFTGNPIIRKDGAVVMGRGAAKEVRDAYPTVQHRLGEILRAHPLDNIAVVQIKPRQCVMWFKVKHHWRGQADLFLIAASVASLKTRADMTKGTTYHMNFPGIGNGRLRYEDVLPILEDLPDNVYVYRELFQENHV